MVPASTAFCSKVSCSDGCSDENDHTTSTSLDSSLNVEYKAENCAGPDEVFGFQRILNIPMEGP